MAGLMDSLLPRKTQIPEGDVANAILRHRSEIDRLDAELLRILRERMAYSSLIGEIKKENNISIFQPDRWRQVLLSMREQGTQLGLTEGFIRNLFIQIHDESVRIQGEIISKPADGQPVKDTEE